jgi:hypothetical protein
VPPTKTIGGGLPMGLPEASRVLPVAGAGGISLILRSS